MRPLYSIIIATLNAKDTVRKCIESVICQKNNSIELLVIDGDSTDGTKHILDQFDAQIDVTISEEDTGIFDAWNKGVAVAKGEWILFIGADDFLEADAFAKYSKFLDENDISKVDYISAKNVYLGKQGQVLKIIGSPWSWRQFRRSMQVAHVASLHKKTLFEEVGLFDTTFTICGDYELLLRKREMLNCLFLDTCIAHMAIGGASYSMRAIRESHLARKMHSCLSPASLRILYLWQVLLFLRNRYLIE